MRNLIELAHRHDFIIAADECYAEIYFSDRLGPAAYWPAAMPWVTKTSSAVWCSIACRNVPTYQACAAASSLVTRTSLSSSATALIRLRFGMHQQRASTLAWQDEAHVQENRALYEQKFHGHKNPRLTMTSVTAGGFYHWLPTPDDIEFCQACSPQHITVMPGTFSDVKTRA